MQIPRGEGVPEGRRGNPAKTKQQRRRERQRQRKRELEREHGEGSLQYGGAIFLEASAFARLVRRSGDAGRSTNLRARARGAWAMLRVLTGLPRIAVSLTDDPSGRVIDGYLRKRRRGVRSHRFARSVLTLPTTSEEYLAGRSRRAVRTNRSHAVSLGITCAGLYDNASAKDAVQSLTVTAGLINPVVLVPRTSDNWLIALDESGEVVGGMLVTIDREWAMFTILVGSSLAVRYALHTDLVLKLIEMGVQHLFATTQSALLLPPGLQHMQRVLGYRVVHLRL
jgi:hypothetical protein